MARSPLNRSTAPLVVRLFDFCFKQGVRDACEFSDDFAVRDWLEKRLEDGQYGLVSEIDEVYDWRRWQHILYGWCRIARMGTMGETYINSVHRYKSTFAFAILPISMRFYLMGVQEWLEYPNPHNMALFNQSIKIHWKPVLPHLKHLRTSDYISLIQDFIYERMKKQYPGDLSEGRYDSFSTAMWRCTQKYIIPDYGEDSADD